MTILIANESADALDNIRELAEETMPDADFICCLSSLDALARARKTEIDIAFLATDMAELDGTDLGQYLIDLYPMVNLIFLSDEEDAAYEAMMLHASGYLLNPADRYNIRRELQDLRHPELVKKHKRVYAQTFGNFELFVDGTPVAFKYTRTKEIVAILVNNRGAQTTNGEIIACLWEDDGDPKKKASYLSNLRQDLQNTFTKLKLNGIILKQRGSMAIATDRIECDLYDWLDKKADSKYRYLGDYMNQYSWSEYRHAELDEISYALEDALY